MPGPEDFPKPGEPTPIPPEEIAPEATPPVSETEPAAPAQPGKRGIRETAKRYGAAFRAGAKGVKEGWKEKRAEREGKTKQTSPKEPRLQINLIRDRDLKRERKEKEKAEKDVKKEEEKAKAKFEEDRKKTQEKRPTFNRELFEETFKVRAEDLGTVEGWSELSDGQRVLVLRNLEELTLGAIKEKAIEQTREETAGAGFVGKVWRGMFRKYYTAKAEKLSADQILAGGIDLHRDVLAELARQTAESGIDAEIDEEGRIRVLYAGRFENLSEEDKKVIDRFNDVADELASVGAEWEYKGKRDEKLEKRYKEALAEVGHIAEREGKGPELYMMDVDRRVRMNQFLNANPDVEEELQGTQSQWVWARALRSTFFERGGYMAMGYATRAATVGLFGLVGAPLAAAGVGGWIGRNRAIGSLEEEAMLAKSGKKHSELITSVKAENLESKLDDLSDKMINAISAGAQAEALKILSQIETRVNYTRYKMEKGLVQYGEGAEKLRNHYELLKTLSDLEVRLQIAREQLGTIPVYLRGKGGVMEPVDQRLDRYLGFKERKVSGHVRSQAIKGAAFGAGFATLGYAIRHAYEALTAGAEAGMPPVAPRPPEGAPVTPAVEQIPADTARAALPTDTIPTDTARTVLPADTAGVGASPDTMEAAPDTAAAAVAARAVEEEAARRTAEEAAAAAAAGAAAEVVPVAEAAETPAAAAEALERGIKSNFELKLGEGQVPPYLERVFHAMALNHMENVLGGDGLFGAEEGAKSLNMAANLVQLAEGKSVAGIAPERVSEIFSWDQRGGTLEVKNYDEFNKLLGELKEHSDNLWERGVLQKGAAAYLDNIRPGTWQRIIEAEGLREVAGTETGIQGHEIQPEQITDFSNDETVRSARELLERSGVPTGVSEEAAAGAAAEEVARGAAEEEVARGAAEEAAAAETIPAGEPVTTEAPAVATETPIAGVEMISEGNLRTLRLANGNEMRFVYDESGNPTEMRFAYFQLGTTGEEHLAGNYQDVIRRADPTNWSRHRSFLYGDAKITSKNIGLFSQFYDKLAGQGGYEREAGMVLRGLRDNIRGFESKYGAGIIDYSKFSERVRRAILG